jgi:formylglycine-generating enzyme required for sulfatase activity
LIRRCLGAVTGLMMAWLVGVWMSVGAYAQTGPPKDTPATYRESIAGTLVNFEMVLVPGGAITLESKTVAVEPFYIGRTEVTWDMYDVFALGLDKGSATGGADATARPSHPYGAPDHGWGHTGYPVISVTRQAAEAFCAWLSAKTGKPYRLATEAEWTRAATVAAGGDKPLPRAQLDSLAWHRDNSSGKSHAIASKKPDALGLHDLFGNAAEWVTTSAGRHITRGGSFRDAPDAAGPAARAEQSDAWNERDPQLPKSRWWLSDGPFVGFRIVSKP